MEKKSHKFEFFSLGVFLVGVVLLLTNGFAARLGAPAGPDVYQEISPIGDVLAIIQDEYVRDTEIKKSVEGALMGIMGSLDRHSSFITADDLKAMQEDTKGEFEGIGVSIKLGEKEEIIVFTPISGSPAQQAGLRPFDIILAIDDISTQGLNLADAADKIRGPRGTQVKLTIGRKVEGKEDLEIKDFFVKRDKVPLESVKEARLLEGGIGYARVSDFKESTAPDLKVRLEDFLQKGMKAFVLDLRWNPGGLLSASKDVCQLFLPKGSLVVYTKGRNSNEATANPDDMKLYTEKDPVLPKGFPVIILVNDQTASSSEIVTGAMQFYQHALILGEKTFGKGSVQTIIPLQKPENTALRLTTALYYTPADVTIDHQGILPDIALEMTIEQERALAEQMYKSYEADPTKMNEQNHGAVTGAAAAEGLVEDLQLAKAVEIIKQDSVWDNLIKQYHKDVHETQVAAEENTKNEDLQKKKAPKAPEAPAPAPETPAPAEPAPADPAPATPAPAPAQ